MRIIIDFSLFTASLAYLGLGGRVVSRMQVWKIAIICQLKLWILVKSWTGCFCLLYVILNFLGKLYSRRGLFKKLLYSSFFVLLAHLL